MTKVVRLSLSSSNAFVSKASVLLSRAELASSRINIGASLCLRYLVLISKGLKIKISNNAVDLC